VTPQDERRLVRAIGKALREERESFPMSQVILAKLIGVSNKQICKIEAGNDTEGLKVLYVAKCLSALSVNFPRFLERVKEKLRHEQ
jgi:DNA-binding XRE family transcriptional regulator